MRDVYPSLHVRFKNIVAVISPAQGSVGPEATPSGAASMPRQDSLFTGLWENVTEYGIVTYYNKKLPLDKVHLLAKEAVENGRGNWSRSTLGT